MGKTMTADEYQTAAQVTCSNMFFGEYVNTKAFIHQLNVCIEAIAELDRMKKLLFYGRGISDVPSEKLGEIKREPFSTLSAIPMTGNDEKMLHALIGVTTEGGEQLEILRDALVAYQIGETAGLVFDSIKLAEEMGGSLWYHAIMFDAMKTTFGEVFKINIAQLRGRYKDKFDAAEANNRNLKFERSVMENVTSLVSVATPETYGLPTADEEIARFVAQDEFTQRQGESNDAYADRLKANML